jgi:hypothetical protein
VIDVTTANRSRRSTMNTNAIDTEKTTTAEAGATHAKAKRTAAKIKPAKKAGTAKRPAGKQKADHANKKAEVIAMMKRAKGATLAEIMADASYCTHLAGCERFSIDPASFR